jgi:hypothetical protein
LDASTAASADAKDAPSPRIAAPLAERLPEADMGEYQSRREATNETPQFTLSIGRIDVEFVQPPPAPSGSAAASDGRTRGFAAYARVRRGSPR